MQRTEKAMLLAAAKSARAKAEEVRQAANEAVTRAELTLQRCEERLQNRTVVPMRSKPAEKPER
jgi:hypothetical protein